MRAYGIFGDQVATKPEVYYIRMLGYINSDTWDQRDFWFVLGGRGTCPCHLSEAPILYYLSLHRNEWIGGMLAGEGAVSDITYLTT